MKIAIVHDYLREFGGAERVFLALTELFPEADVYVGFFDEKQLGAQWLRFSHLKIRTTWLQKVPFMGELFSPLRWMAPFAFLSLDLSKYDVVISSTNAFFAKAIRVPSGVHLCYCHTPPRALYGFNAKSNWRGNVVTFVLGSVLNALLRPLDWWAAQRVDVFVANSAETAGRIKRFYNRDSVTVAPPVSLPPPAPPATNPPPGFDHPFLYVNRLTLAKHPELAVAACTQLQLPLVVIGAGPMEAELRRLAGPTIYFAGSLSDANLRWWYNNARALLYPVEDEDFGIVPVEAMQAGLPVIAHFSGGPKETVVGPLLKENGRLSDLMMEGAYVTAGDAITADKKIAALSKTELAVSPTEKPLNLSRASGLFFHSLTTESLSNAVLFFISHAREFQNKSIQQQGSRYSREMFDKKMRELVSVRA